MKKSLVVLLIAVLVAGSAFAAVTGTASLSFGYDMEDEDFALVNAGVDGAAASFTFAIDSQSGATAASDKAVYAKAAGEYSLAIKDGVLASELTFTEAYVMGEGWSVDFTSVENGLKVEALGATLTGWYKQKGDWGIKIESGKVEIVDGLTASAYFGYAKVQDDKDNVANYALDIDLDDEYETYLKKYEDGTYKVQYLNDMVEKKDIAYTSKSNAKKAYLANPTQGTQKAYNDACDDYDDAVKNLAKALTFDGMLSAYVNDKPGITSVTDLGKAIGKYYYGKKYLAFNTDKADDYTLIPGDTADFIKLFKSSTKAKYVSTTDLEFLGTHTVETGLDVAYVKNLFAADASFDIVVENDEVDSWNVGGSIAYDFASANVGIDNDKVLNAGIAVDLSSFLGYDFSFSVAANDMLENDPDEEIDRDLVIGLDTTFAGLEFGFDGTINWTDEDVAFKFALGYDKFDVALTWTAPWEDDFKAIDEKKYTIGVDASYAGDVVTAKANILVENVGDPSYTNADHEYTLSNRKVTVGASVETDALIDNATVGVQYTDGVYMYGYDNEDGIDGLDAGAVTAFIKVAF